VLHSTPCPLPSRGGGHGCANGGQKGKLVIEVLWREAQGAPAQRFERRVAFGVAALAVGRFVQWAIDFNRDAQAHDCKVGDVFSDRMLAANGEAFVAQQT
jgi:hypothetical protein